MDLTGKSVENDPTTAGRPDLNITVTDVIPHVLIAGRTNLIFVEIQTDAGITGVGEASLELRRSTRARSGSALADWDGCR